MVSINKNNSVLNIFNSIAPVYDILNDIISLQMHKKWKALAVDQLSIQSSDKILDLCCGSGDIIRLILSENTNVDVVGIDFSNKMLQIATRRFKDMDNVILLNNDVMSLPFDDASFDKVIISFGLRNLPDIDLALKEIFRVVKRDGIYVNIDFGKPEYVVFKLMFDLYFLLIVPMFSQLFKKYAEYYYLHRSIKVFPAPSLLLQKMKKVGFCNTVNTNYFMGFVAIQKATK